jgi:hypothetical protein
MDYIEIKQKEVEMLISDNEDCNLITIEMTNIDHFGLVNNIVMNINRNDIRKVIKFLTKHK